MAIMAGAKRFPDIRVPALVIFAIPRVPENWINRSKDPAVRESAEAYFSTLNGLTEQQAKAFEVGVPNARVVRLEGAHYIFLSNEPSVLREMRAFLAALQ